MNCPERLIAAGATEAERRLLQAGLSEEPPPAGVEQLALALGLSAAAAPLSPMPESATQPAPATGALPAGSKVVGTVGGLKWLALVGGVITIGGAALLALPRGTEQLPERLQVQGSGARSAVQPQPTAEQPTPPDAIASSGARPAEPAPSVPSTLADELARLDHVRAELTQRGAEPALSALLAYRQIYPHGALREEAALLQFEALSRSNEPRRTRAVASEFLRRYPDSVHAPRVRAWLAEAADAR